MLLIMIYKTVREYLKQNRVKGKDLAARLGISTSHMSMIKRGERRPSPELARKIEAATGIPVLKLLFKEGDAASR